MRKFTDNQRGFAAVEAVLLVVIVAMIAGTGYFVWHSNQVANKTLAPDNSKTPTFKKATKPATTTPATSTKTTGSTTTKSTSTPVTVAVSAIKVSPGTIYCVADSSKACVSTKTCTTKASIAQVTMNITNSDSVTAASIDTYWVGGNLFSGNGPSFALTRSGTSSTWTATLKASSFPASYYANSGDGISTNNVDVHLTVKDGASITGLTNNPQYENGGDAKVSVGACS